MSAWFLTNPRPLPRRPVRTILQLETLESRSLLSNVLVFTKTAGFHHDSIPAAIAAVEQLGTEHGFHVDQTEDAGAFTDANLSHYQAVVFLLTTGEVLNSDQEAAFQRFIEAGNGYVGVHSAADTGYDWPWYGQLMGAYFQSHPRVIQTATIHILDHNYPSTAFLPDDWVRADEWYNFASDPRDNGATVLASLDESTYMGGNMGGNHPIMWYHAFDGGRAWYTAGGHTEASYSEPLFLESLLGGIRYATGDASRMVAPIGPVTLPAAPDILPLRPIPVALAPLGNPGQDLSGCCCSPDSGCSSCGSDTCGAAPDSAGPPGQLELPPLPVAKVTQSLWENYSSDIVEALGTVLSHRGESA
jgi:type 1 glutamine amidotransferase